MTPGCGVAAFLLLYDTHRALRPRIAAEQPWRETRALGIATLVVGALVLPRVQGPAWMNGAIAAVLALALVPLLWSSLSGWWRSSCGPVPTTDRPPSGSGRRTYRTVMTAESVR